MDRKILFAALIAFALAGCADAPPSGEFASSSNAVVADGSVTIDYQEEVKPFDDNPGDVDSPVDCVDDAAPGQLDEFKCVDPYTNTTSHFMTLSEPGSGTYSLYWVDSAGDNEEEKMMDLVYDNGTMFNGAMEIQEDVSGMYDTVELRLDTFKLATAATAEGDNSFTLHPNATTAVATATYKGKDLTVDVSGLQLGIGYTGWLVGEDENGMMEHLESFTITQGTNEYTAEKSINKYSAFHIHVGNSKVNVAIAQIE